MDALPHQAPHSGRSAEIMFVVSALQIGGAERQLSLLVSSLIPLGWRISVYSIYGNGPLKDELEKNGVTVILPPLDRPAGSLKSLRGGAYLLALAVHLFASMMRRRPGIAHFMLPGAYLVGGPLAVLAGIPHLVMSRRSLNLYQGSDVIRAAERWLHRRQHALIGNSRSVINELRKEGAGKDRLALIYNGVDTTAEVAEGARAAMRQSLGVDQQTLVLCIVANLIPYKGHRDLFEALASANARLPEWRLLVVGRDDGIGRNLKELAARLGIDAKIMFIGSRPDVSELYAASDIGILCSHQESFSNAILEGMVAGIPMIVTDVGGNPEAVIDGESGLVVPSRNPAALAEAIERLAADAPLRAKLGAAGRKRAVEKFDLPICIGHHDALYRAVLVNKLPSDIEDIRVN